MRFNAFCISAAVFQLVAALLRAIRLGNRTVTGTAICDFRKQDL